MGKRGGLGRGGKLLPVKPSPPTPLPRAGEGSEWLPADWNRPDWDKLWLYNLHYFDDLNAESAAERRDW